MISCWQMAKIFISYRREDSQASAGRVNDRLVKTFGQHEIFMDVDAIGVGVDFVEAIEEAVGQCDVLIAVIGRNWLNITGKKGTRLLDSQNDFVRVEIRTALKRKIPVIPLLVDDADMPGEEDLPADLHPLVRRNGLEIIHNRFNTDMARLEEALKNIFDKQSTKIVSADSAPQPVKTQQLVKASQATPVSQPAPSPQPVMSSQPSPSPIGGRQPEINVAPDIRPVIVHGTYENNYVTNSIIIALFLISLVMLFIRFGLHVILSTYASAILTLIATILLFRRNKKMLIIGIVVAILISLAIKILGYDVWNYFYSPSISILTLLLSATFIIIYFRRNRNTIDR